MSHMKHLCWLAFIILITPLGAQASWTVSNKTSQLDGTHTFTAELYSQNQLPNSIGELDPSLLVVRCKNGELSVFIDFPPFMGDDARPVRWKFDGGEVQHGDWDGSQDGEAIFSQEPYDFLSSLASGHKLVVSVAPYEQVEVEAIFNLAGGKKVADAASRFCPRPSSN